LTRLRCSTKDCKTDLEVNPYGDPEVHKQLINDTRISQEERSNLQEWELTRQRHENKLSTPLEQDEELNRALRLSRETAAPTLKCPYWYIDETGTVTTREGAYMDVRDGKYTILLELIPLR
jgi:hypothetical protein